MSSHVLSVESRCKTCGTLNYPRIPFERMKTHVHAFHKMNNKPEHEVRMDLTSTCGAYSYYHRFLEEQERTKSKKHAIHGDKYAFLIMLTYSLKSVDAMTKYEDIKLTDENSDIVDYIDLNEDKNDKQLEQTIRSCDFTRNEVSIEVDEGYGGGDMCVCSKNGITKLYVIQNNETNTTITVGAICITKYGMISPAENAIVKAKEKAKKQRELKRKRKTTTYFKSLEPSLKNPNMSIEDCNNYVQELTKKLQYFQQLTEAPRMHRSDKASYQTMMCEELPKYIQCFEEKKNELTIIQQTTECLQKLKTTENIHHILNAINNCVQTYNFIVVNKKHNEFYCTYALYMCICNLIDSDEYTLQKIKQYLKRHTSTFDWCLNETDSAVALIREALTLNELDVHYMNFNLIDWFIENEILHLPNPFRNEMCMQIKDKCKQYGALWKPDQIPYIKHWYVSKKSKNHTVLLNAVGTHYATYDDTNINNICKTLCIDN